MHVGSVASHDHWDCQASKFKIPFSFLMCMTENDCWYKPTAAIALAFLEFIFHLHNFLGVLKCKNPN